MRTILVTSLLVFLLAVEGCSSRSSEALRSPSRDRVTPKPLFDGEISSGGGEVARGQQNPWYLGDKPVGYCIEVEPSYANLEPQLAKVVAESLDDWRAFFQRYGLAGRKYPFARLAFPDHIRRGLSLSFEPRKRCVHDSEELRFLFTFRQGAKEASLPLAEGAYGQSVRGPYNDRTYRNGGTVWVHLDLYTQLAFRLQRARDGRFKHMLLHQLGHVFGMPHDSVYVMDEHVAGTFFVWESQVPFDRSDEEDPMLGLLFGRIESPSWPYRWRAGETLDLTFNGGRDPRHDFQGDGTYQAVHPHAYPGSTIPPELRSRFGLSEDAWYSLRLKLLSADLRLEKSWQLELDLQPEGKPARLFIGEFRAASENGDFEQLYHYAPSLCTNWDFSAMQTPEQEPLNFSCVMLDDTPVSWPLRGYFTVNGQTLPAIIDNQRGVRLMLFSSGEWWVLHPHLQYF